MSTYYKFRRPMLVEQLVDYTKELGWKLETIPKVGTLCLKKTSYIHVNLNNEKQVIGLTCYGIQDCESLTFLANDPDS